MGEGTGSEVKRSHSVAIVVRFDCFRSGRSLTRQAAAAAAAFFVRALAGWVLGNIPE